MKETNISVVVPVLNEQEVLKEFYTRLSSALNKIDNNCEIIFIDDGSTDSSLRILEDLNGKDKRKNRFVFKKFWTPDSHIRWP